MTKPKEEVIKEFNLLNNMTVEELQAWLDDPKSKAAGTGAGFESGHRIVEILKKNPTKDPEKYDDEDIEHMRKVVSYDKRHIAQEDRLKESKTQEELENTKSTISLKNWGHDPMKALDEGDSGDEQNDKDVSENETAATDTLTEDRLENIAAVGTGAKRKLAESTMTDYDAKRAEEKAKQDDIGALAKEAGVDFEDVGAAGSEAVFEEQPEEKRARKKSKTDIERDEETVDE